MKSILRLRKGFWAFMDFEKAYDTIDLEGVW